MSRALNGNRVGRIPKTSFLSARDRKQRFCSSFSRVIWTKFLSELLSTLSNRSSVSRSPSEEWPCFYIDHVRYDMQIVRYDMQILIESRAQHGGIQFLSTGSSASPRHFTRCQLPLGPSNRSLFTGYLMFAEK